VYVTFVATGPNQTYKIQFWTWDDDTEEPGADEFFIEIIGSEIKKDKKNKVLTVTFTEKATWEYRSER
jgi:hypothetical protein